MTGNALDGARAFGLYGLLALNGAPLDPRDAGVLGLVLGEKPTSAAFAGYDADSPHRVSRDDGPDGSTLLVGDLWAMAELADRLGQPRDAAPAQVAAAALARFGADTPAELIGEWSLLHWHREFGLTLMQSAGRSDRIFYAVVRNRVAVAPNLFVLTHLPWVGTAVDAAGMLFPLGRAGVRRGQGDSTMLARVREVEPAGSVIVSPDGRVTKRTAQVLTSQPRFTGSYGDALAEIEALVRRMMRDRLARHARVAPMCSGGLDSSFTSWLAAAERQDEQQLLLMTSVAPPGSELADEADYAAMVATHLGAAQMELYPALDADIYRPPGHILSGGNGPILSNRHVLTERFHQVARGAGATLMIDGTYGEMSVTARLPFVETLSPMRTLRRLAGRAVRGVQGVLAGREPEVLPFHVRLAPHRLAALPEQVGMALELPDRPGWSPMGDDLFGYVSGIEKGLMLPNCFYPGAVRVDYFYRDARLLRLIAGMPVALLGSEGHDRPVVRRLLDGQLPDAVRLRRRGMPASPDHLVRLQRQAAAARGRIADFRRAEVDDWIDLDWLDGALAQVAARGPRDHGEANEVQLTAIAAEFFCWWRARS